MGRDGNLLVLDERVELVELLELVTELEALLEVELPVEDDPVDVEAALVDETEVTDVEDTDATDVDDALADVEAAVVADGLAVAPWIPKSVL